MPESTHSGKHVLLVDSDEAFCHVLRKVLGPKYTVRSVPSVHEAISELDTEALGVILLNMEQPKDAATAPNWRDMLKAATERPFGGPPVIVYGWDSRQVGAREAFQEGSFDFFEQPLDVKELKFALDRAYRRAALVRDFAATQRMLPLTQVEGLLGNSKAMERVKEIVHKIAGVLTPVLISGERGTGKEMVARAIHRLGPRANKPFVVFSARALSESLAEDELFGRERDARAGLSEGRRGRLEEAKGGTIFLDEIGDLAVPVQANLLRVLQERSFERQGLNQAVPTDVRVICTTSQNLERMIQEGMLREDLYSQISVVKIDMPPLRERGSDIPLLAECFLREFAKAHNKRVRGMTAGFLSAMASYSWPGNVRELQNMIERSLVLADSNELLGVEELPPELRGLAIADSVPSGSFHVAIRSFKRELIRSALRRNSGNRLRAAQELRISRCYLHRLLNQLNVNGAEMTGESAGTLVRDSGERALRTI